MSRSPWEDDRWLPKEWGPGSSGGGGGGGAGSGSGGGKGQNRRRKRASKGSKNRGTGGGAPFNPLAHANLAGYWDMTDPSTVTTDVSGKPGVQGEWITQVDDQSGSGFHLTQGTGANRPQYSAIGDGIMHANMASNDFLRHNAAVPASTVIAGVYMNGSSANDGKAVIMNNGTISNATGLTGTFRNIWYSPLNQWRTDYGGNPSTEHMGITNARSWKDKTNTVVITYDAKMVISADVTGLAYTPVYNEGLLVGEIQDVGDYYMRGKVFCLAMFDAVLSDADREDYVDYFADLMGYTI